MSRDPNIDLADAVRLARESGDFGPFVDAIPYARFMGFSFETRDGELVGTMRYSDHLIGNAHLPALHGGTVGAFLESTAIFGLLWRAETVTLPKIINLTVQYLRSARAQDTFARCEITRQGRRVANVRAWAWQDDPQKPVATANAHFLLR